MKLHVPLAKPPEILLSLAGPYQKHPNCVLHRMLCTPEANSTHNVKTVLPSILDLDPKSNIPHTLHNSLHRYIRSTPYMLVRPWKPQCSNLGNHRHCPNNNTLRNPCCQNSWTPRSTGAPENTDGQRSHGFPGLHWNAQTVRLTNLFHVFLLLASPHLSN